MGYALLKSLLKKEKLKSAWENRGTAFWGCWRWIWVGFSPQNLLFRWNVPPEFQTQIMKVIRTFCQVFSSFLYLFIAPALIYFRGSYSWGVSVYLPSVHKQVS